MLLLNLGGPGQAFVAMRNLLERSCLRAFYGGHAARDDVSSADCGRLYSRFIFIISQG